MPREVRIASTNVPDSIPIKAFEHGEHKRQILQLLTKGEREIAAGRGFDLSDVLAEADEVLAKGRLRVPGDRG